MAPAPMQPWTRSGYTAAGQRGQSTNPSEAWSLNPGLTTIEPNPDVPTLLISQTDNWIGWRADNWISARAHSTTFSTYSPPNPPYADWGTRHLWGFYAARSFHTGGVNAVMGDGSGRFVSNTIAQQVWRDMSRISDSL